MHAALSLPLWQSHQQNEWDCNISICKGSRWLCWVGGERLLGVGGLGGGGGPWHSEVFWLTGRTRKKRGKAIVPGKRCPGQACDLPSFLQWLTFGAAGDGGIHLFPVLWTTAWYKGLSDKQSQQQWDKGRKTRPERGTALLSKLIIPLATCHMLSLHIFTFSRGQSSR